METYLIINILVFFSCVFEYGTSNGIKRNVLFFWMIFFTLFAGLRWGVGPDWEQYYQHFQRSEWSNIFSYDRYGNGRELLEPGFVFLNVLIKSLFGEYYWFNILASGFCQYTLIRFCYHFSPKYPILLYSFMMLFASYSFVVRAGLAISIGYWCYNAIYTRNLKQFLFVVSCAFMVHNQCIVLLPLYWIGKIRLNIYSLSLLYIIFAFMGFLFQQYFSILALAVGGDLGEKVYGYTQGETEGFKGASYMGWALNYFFMYVYIYLRKVNEII